MTHGRNSRCDLHATSERTGPPQSSSTLSDEDVVSRVLAGDVAAFEILMRRYNQRIFRVARSVVGDDDEAEDVVQDAYFRAFEHLNQFAGRASFATWLTRIALYEALARRRRRQRMQVVDWSDPRHSTKVPTMANSSPEHATAVKELGGVLIDAVDELPDDLRTVFALRMIEGLDTNETADCLELTEANVKVRLHRAKLLLRERIDERVGAGIRQLYGFGGERCDRIVRKVLARLMDTQFDRAK